MSCSVPLTAHFISLGFTYDRVYFGVEACLFSDLICGTVALQSSTCTSTSTGMGMGTVDGWRKEEGGGGKK
jgi:hypothetical protein